MRQQTERKAGGRKDLFLKMREITSRERSCYILMGKIQQSKGDSVGDRGRLLKWGSLDERG